MINVVILNHFIGYPALEDACSHALRYSKLLNLIQVVDAKNTIFLYNAIKTDKKFKDIMEISKTNGSEWLKLSDSQSIESVLQNIKNKFSIDITQENSTIILGGTNTAGCLLRTSNFSAKQWAKKEFNVKFCLSICTDYELDGINTVEKNQIAAAIMYQFIKENKFTDYIDVVYNPMDLVR